MRVGSTCSGVSPCHHLRTAGLANHAPTASAISSTTSISRCCSQHSARRTVCSSQRIHPGGCHVPTSPRSKAASGLHKTDKNFTSTWLAAASF